MGTVLAQEGRLDEAAAYFRQAVAIDPQSVEGHFNLGVALARLNRVDEAAEQFAYVLRLRPDATQARAWLQRLGR
jgi:tetratricopeptide (TPR) repeat protein